jgi:hypothetical protein
MSLEEIVKSLESIGIEHKVLQTGTDGAALILPEYGRILGLWPYWRGENAFWTNPEFFRSLRTGAKRTEWVNPGGDRMWLCPETEFFIPDTGRPLDTYGVPAALDPGAFACVSEKRAYSMENRGDLWAFRSEARIGFRIERRIRVFEPQELALRWGTTYLRQAGYAEETVLEVFHSPVPVGLWNATCLNAGGEAHIPLQKYWADTRLPSLPVGTVELEAGSAVIGCRGDREIKASLEAAEVKGRGGYVVENGDSGRAVMVLKEFEKAAPDRYAREITGDGGTHGVTVGVSYGGGGPSCEIAFRSPATGGLLGRKKVLWKSSLWAFSGRTEEVRAFLRRALLDR